MTEDTPKGGKLRVADLSQSAATGFALHPDAAQMKQIATELELDGLRKMRFTGEVTADGTRDWLLTGKIGATVVQPCVVTLKPVTTRIEADVRRLYVPDFTEPQGEEVEMPEDDEMEPLGREIDLNAVMIEALSLALPVYPRADEAKLDETNFTEPGKQAMTDDDAKPFAALAALKAQQRDDD
ncbi:YceD family protein [Marinibacterium profundimaris]|uniref:50S ribosomal protein L34 n=1 Tax=Marinibacterium profundimaris TaxID=1679460 RepID=A0A225NWS8_9RHOB|nr:DUF177 domain-containing protein [Marinibacterium profundimaris]OWU77797.1 50S ribosomal protein L34 [Marinibacterium profundimaris]